MAPRRRSATDLSLLLEKIDQQSAPDLRPLWAEVFGTSASPHLSTPLLRQALAHRLQEQTFGGVERTVLRRLHRLAADERAGKARARTLHPGTRLVREWRGETHVVEVTAEGYCWQGQSFRSLSRVATAITGTRWSGPRFFGLQRGCDDQGR